MYWYIFDAWHSKIRGGRSIQNGGGGGQALNSMNVYIHWKLGIVSWVNLGKVCQQQHTRSEMHVAAIDMTMAAHNRTCNFTESLW